MVMVIVIALIFSEVVISCVYNAKKHNGIGMIVLAFVASLFCGVMVGSLVLCVVEVASEDSLSYSSNGKTEITSARIVNDAYEWTDSDGNTHTINKASITASHDDKMWIEVFSATNDLTFIIERRALIYVPIGKVVCYDGMERLVIEA